MTKGDGANEHNLASMLN